MVEWKALLKRILKKFGVTIRTCFVSLWLMISGNNGQHNKETSCSIKCLLFFFNFIFCQGKGFFCCLKPSRLVLGTTQSPIHVVLGFFLGNKVDQSPVFNAGIKNERSCTFLPPLRLHGVNRDGFASLYPALFYGVRGGAVR